MKFKSSLKYKYKLYNTVQIKYKYYGFCTWVSLRPPCTTHNPVEAFEVTLINRTPSLNHAQLVAHNATIMPCTTKRCEVSGGSANLEVSQ